MEAIVREGEGPIRIKAAEALPGNAEITDALVYVVQHDRTHAVRQAAAVNAVGYDERLARPAMRWLVEDPRTPERIREQARQRLG